MMFQMVRRVLEARRVYRPPHEVERDVGGRVEVRSLSAWLCCNLTILLRKGRNNMTIRFYTNFFAVSKHCPRRRLAASPSEVLAPRHSSSSSLSSTPTRSQAKSPPASSSLNFSSFCSIYTHPRLSLPARKDRFLSPEAQDSARHGKARRPSSPPT